jgi:hypothetical protein
LVAQFQYNQDTDTYTCPQGETLKPQAVGIRKPPIETAIILKIPNPKMQSMSVKHLCTSRASGREIDQTNMPMPSRENNKRYHENPQLYRNDRRLTSTFLAPLNANGVTIIPI